MTQPNGWDDDRRARQAALIQGWKPWLHSTGPKSAEGKKAVSMNGLKHGGRSRALRLIRDLVRRGAA